MPIEHSHARVGERIDQGAVVAVVMVKTSLERQVVMLPLAQVPLAHHPGGVTGFAERFGDGALVGQHAVFGRVGGPDHGAVLPGVAAGHQAAPGGRTDGLDVKLGELHAFAGDAVDVRCGHLGAAGEAHLVPAHVVGEEDDDVGTRRGEGNRGE